MARGQRDGSDEDTRWLLRADLLLTDAWSDPISDAGVLVEGSRVESVGPFAAVARTYPLAQTVPVGPGLVLPGLIDAHSHGRSYPLEAQDLREISLEQFILRLGAMSTVAAGEDAFAAAADLISTGVTSAQVNFHTFAGADAYLAAARETLAGLRHSGIRSTFVPCLIEQNAFVAEAVLADAPDGLRALDRHARDGVTAAEYFEICEEVSATAEDGMTSFAVGPCAPHWCSVGTWDRVGGLLARGHRAQTHLLEARSQRSPLYGAPAVPTLDQARALTPQLSAAHGVWLDDAELATLSAAGVTLVHCPGSNTRLASGRARVRDWLRNGISVAFGLDSNTRTDPPDVFAELRHAAAVAHEIGAPLAPRELLAMATLGGAAACGQAGELGQLQPGARADMVAVSLPGLSAAEDAPTCLLASATREAVTDVWVDGKTLVHDGRYVHAMQTTAAQRTIARTLAQDAAARADRMRALLPLEQWARHHMFTTEPEHIDSSRVTHSIQQGEARS